MKILRWVGLAVVLVAAFVFIARSFERPAAQTSALIVVAGQSNALGSG